MWPGPALPCVAISALYCRLHRSFRGGLHLIPKDENRRPTAVEPIRRSRPERTAKVPCENRRSTADSSNRPAPDNSATNGETIAAPTWAHREPPQASGRNCRVTPGDVARFTNEAGTTPVRSIAIHGYHWAEVSPTGRGPSSSPCERPSGPAQPRDAENQGFCGKQTAEKADPIRFSGKSSLISPLHLTDRTCKGRPPGG